MTISENLLGGPRNGLPAPSSDPFDVDDTLAEADLQKIDWDVASNTCRLLFDLKYAFVYPEANTAIVVARGVRSAQWTRPGVADDGWQTFMVETSTIRLRDGGYDLFVGAVNGGRLALSAAVLEFWTGEAAGADEAPPDYTQDDDATIRAGLTNWDWPFTPVGRVVRAAGGDSSVDTP